MKKAVIFVVLTAIVIGNFALANKAEAISIAKRIECVFHPSHCSKSNSGSTSSSVSEPSAPAADVNHSPVWATNQTYFYTKTGQLLQFTLSATDPDNDTLTYGVSFVPSGANFDAYARIFSWTPNGYQQGNYYMQFSVTDGEYSSYLTVTVNVTEAANSNSNNGNRHPVWNTISTQTVTPGQFLQFSVYATDPDNDYITYEALNLPSGANFNVYSRTFTWTPSTGQTGSYVASFRASDGNGNYSDMGVYISVLGPQIVNNPPVFLNFNPPATGKVGQTYVYDVSATDPDNDPISYSLISGPTGPTINTSSGLILWTPTELQTNFSNVVIAVSDGKVQVSRSFFIFVNAANTAPIVTAPAPRPAAKDELIISNLSIVSDDNGDIAVIWETNIPSYSPLIYDTASQGNKTGNFTYANATPTSETLETKHKVNLGKLEAETVYYLRAVAKTSDQTAVSREMTFVQLPDKSVRAFGVASIFDILGPIFTSPVFLFLVIISLGVFAYLQNRKINKMTAPL